MTSYNNSNKRILVVDDEEISRVTIKDNFESLGCMVNIATTGEEAIRLAQQNPYDLILLDLNMFDMGGLNVAKRLREMTEKIDNVAIKDIPLVAVTIYNHSSVRNRAKKLGFKDYVVKPMDLEKCKKILNLINSDD